MPDVTFLVEGFKASWPAMICIAWVAWVGREMILALGGKVDLGNQKLDDHFNSCPNIAHKPKKSK